MIILGLVALAYQGITYTTREKITDLGPPQASVDKKKTILLPPVLGALTPCRGRGADHRWSSKIAGVTVAAGDRPTVPMDSTLRAAM